MEGFFKITITRNTTPQERELISMLMTQKSWAEGMGEFLTHYKKKIEKKLSNLGNDHDTDLMCKVMIELIDFILEIPYAMNNELKKGKRSKKEV
jgi:hypothetical protein